MQRHQAAAKGPQCVGQQRSCELLCTRHPHEAARRCAPCTTCSPELGPHLACPPCVRAFHDKAEIGVPPSQLLRVPRQSLPWFACMPDAARWLPPSTSACPCFTFFPLIQPSLTRGSPNRCSPSCPTGALCSAAKQAAICPYTVRRTPGVASSKLGSVWIAPCA